MEPFLISVALVSVAEISPVVPGILAATLLSHAFAATGFEVLRAG